MIYAIVPFVRDRSAEYEIVAPVTKTLFRHRISRTLEMRLHIRKSMAPQFHATSSSP